MKTSEVEPMALGPASAKRIVAAEDELGSLIVMEADDELTWQAVNQRNGQRSKGVREIACDALDRDEVIV